LLLGTFFKKGSETLVYIIDVRSKEGQMSPTLGYQNRNQRRRKREERNAMMVV
jgi:hypothetical protein